MSECLPDVYTPMLALVQFRRPSKVRPLTSNQYMGMGEVASVDNTKADLGLEQLDIGDG